MKKYLVLVIWKSPVADFTGTDIHTKVLYELDSPERAKAMVDDMNKRRQPNFYYKVASISIPKF